MHCTESMFKLISIIKIIKTRYATVEGQQSIKRHFAALCEENVYLITHVVVVFCTP